MASLEVTVITAYLGPLLEKHQLGSEITYEDLTSSWQSSMKAIGEAKGSSPESTSQIKSKLTALHQSQLKSYRETAKAACMLWADGLELPAAPNKSEDSLSLAQYVSATQQWAETTRQPNWTLSAVHKKLVYQKIEERATDLFNNNNKNNNTGSSLSHSAEEEEEQEDDDDEDMAAEPANESATSDQQPPATNKKGKSAIAKKKVAPTKKGATAAKAGKATKKGVSGQNRRGGRGRGKVAKLL